MNDRMDLPLDRRRLLAGASAAAASLLMPGAHAAAPGPLSPERALESYSRILCGPIGQEVLWWFIGDLYYQEPGKSVVPFARSLTIGGYTALQSSARAFKYRFREAGVIIELATGEPMKRNPFTDRPAEVPLVDEQPHEIDWLMQDDGSILRTQHGKQSKLNFHWTETSANLLLLETQPGKNAFALAPGDAGVEWKGIESTRTLYAKRAHLKRPGYVPADMIFHVALKFAPPWLAFEPAVDRYFIVRGLGQKSRAKEVVNQDALDLVRRLFPKFL
jgi:hypothetical protein